MSWERGLKRLALVFAVLVGVSHCVFVVAYGGAWLSNLIGLIRLERLEGPVKDLTGLLIAFVIGFLPVWGVPWAICWAIRGFEGNANRAIAGDETRASKETIQRLKWLHK